MSTVAILGTRYPDLSIEEEILAGVTLVTSDGATADDIVAATADAEVVIAGSRPLFTAEVLDRMKLRAIVRSGIGVDSVDLDRARELGYWVAYVPDYGTEAVAFHTVALILAALRRIPQADRLVKRGEWGFADLRPMHLPTALTVGIVGYGRIGRRVHEHLDGLGFGAVLVHDPFIEAEWVDLGELLARSDVVTLHAPGPQDGSPLLGATELGCMKPGSLLVNTARGTLVDQRALAAGLAYGTPGYAALDVFAPEPPELLVFAGVEDRLIATPHTAWYTQESQADLRAKSAREALRILNGEAPLHAVVRPEES